MEGRERPRSCFPLQILQKKKNLKAYTLTVDYFTGEGKNKMTELPPLKVCPFTL